MRDFKGTPGPWMYVVRNVNELMTTFHGVTIGDTYIEAATRNESADALLISAAPELLEALQEMVGCIEYYAGLKESEQPNIEDWAYASNSSEIEKARHAINKALGK